MQENSSLLSGRGKGTCLILFNSLFMIAFIIMADIETLLPVFLGMTVSIYNIVAMREKLEKDIWHTPTFTEKHQTTLIVFISFYLESWPFEQYHFKCWMGNLVEQMFIV